MLRLLILGTASAAVALFDAIAVHLRCHMPLRSDPIQAVDDIPCMCRSSVKLVRTKQRVPREGRVTVDLHQLLSAVTVAETRSVTTAAERLRIAQPAVSRHIQSLEQELGVELFDRTREGTSPTSAGEIFVEHARRALDELDTAKLSLSRGQASLTGRVELGVLESVIDILVPPLLRRVRETHPGVEVRVRRATPATSHQWVGPEPVDLSILYAPTAPASVFTRSLVTDEIWLVGPSDAPLRSTEPVSWGYALEQPLILPIAGHGLRSLIDSAISAHSAVPSVVLEANAMSVQKQMVRAGSGWTILPATGVFAEVAAGVLTGAPLKEPTIVRNLVLGKPRRARGMTLVDVIAREIVDVTRDLIGAGEWPGAVIPTTSVESR